MRFERTERLYGTQGVQVLKDAHVCVCGVGGVGSWASEALARSAIGHLTLIDMDEICETNINRQIHALDSSVHHRKAHAMAQRIKEINPECKVTVIDDFLSLDNIATYVDTKFDYVLDAIDSIQSKAALIAHCRRNKIKVICSGGAGGQIDPTQIQVADLSRTIQDPLASKLRNILRKEYGFTTNSKRKFAVDCVFSSEQQQFTQIEENGKVSRVFGTSMMVTASFGLVAAAHIVNKILQKKVPSL